MFKKSDLTSKQQKALDRLHDLLEETERDLLWHHRVGEQVQILCPKRDYGSELIKKLADEFDADPVKLSTARKFFRDYRKREVQTLSKTSPTGFTITWSHMVHLLSLDPKDRDSFQAKCLENKWSSRELHEQIKDFRSPKGKGGRKFKKQENVESALRQLVKESRTWKKRFDEVWFNDEDPAIPPNPAKYRSRKAKALAAKAVGILENLQSDIAEAVATLKPIVASTKPSAASKKPNDLSGKNRKTGS